MPSRKNEEIDSFQLFLFWVIGFIVSIGVFVAARSSYLEYQDFLNDGIIIQAEVTEVDLPTEDSSSSYGIIYQYVVDGELYEADKEWISRETILNNEASFDEQDSEVSLSEGELRPSELSEQPLFVGDEVGIYYLPSNPSESMIIGNEPTYHAPLYLSLPFIGVFSLPIFAFEIPKQWRQTRLEQWINTLRSFGVLGYFIFCYSVVIWIEPLDDRRLNGGIFVAFVLPLILSILFFATNVIEWLNTWLEYRQLDRRTHIDVSNHHRELPKNMQEYQLKLGRLGFERLGETTHKLPIKDDKAVAWLFHSKDSTTVAEIIPASKLVRFYSWYDDEQRIEVTFPNGDKIDLPRFQTRYVRESINKAYKLHRRISQAYYAKNMERHTR